LAEPFGADHQKASIGLWKASGITVLGRAATKRSLLKDANQVNAGLHLAPRRAELARAFFIEGAGNATIDLAIRGCNIAVRRRGIGGIPDAIGDLAIGRDIRSIGRCRSVRTTGPHENQREPYYASVHQVYLHRPA
jgi:hypothetical protein